MKKKHVIFHFLYYVVTIVVYMAFFYASSLMLDLIGKADNLGSVMAVTYGVLFVMTPVLVAVMMRFSLLSGTWIPLLQRKYLCSCTSECFLIK